MIEQNKGIIMSDNNTMGLTREEMIEKIVEVFKSNPQQYSDARIQREVLNLNAASIKNIEKQYNLFAAQKNDKDFDEKVKKVSNASGADLKEFVSNYLAEHLKTHENKVKKALVALVADTLPIVKLQMNGNPVVDLGVQHKQFKKLLGACITRSIAGPTNVWLTGPAGSGKTKAAEGVAKALNIQFQFNGAIDTPYKLMGFRDAAGNTNRTAFREAYENGGVYLFDEVDASQPAALLAFNAALANGYADFPDGRITRHPDCVIIAAANTWGTGPNSDYVGRNKLDAAFIDRFVQLAWEYDNNLEKILAQHDAWVDFVQAVRANVMQKQIKTVVSPRASISGAALLKTGMFSAQEVMNMTIKKGMSQDNWTQAIHGINTNIDVTDGGKYTVETPEGFETTSKRKP